MDHSSWTAVLVELLSSPYFPPLCVLSLFVPHCMLFPSHHHRVSLSTVLSSSPCIFPYLRFACVSKRAFSGRFSFVSLFINRCRRTETRGGHFHPILTVRILRAQTDSAPPGGATAHFSRRPASPRSSYTLHSHPSFIIALHPPSSACLYFHSFCTPVTSSECAPGAHPWSHRVRRLSFRGRHTVAAVLLRRRTVVPSCAGTLAGIAIMSLRRLMLIHSLRAAIAVCHQGAIWLHVLLAVVMPVLVPLRLFDGGAPPSHLHLRLEDAFCRGSICAASSASSLISPRTLLPSSPLVIAADLRGRVVILPYLCPYARSSTR